MTEKDKINKLRKGIMCAVIHLFDTNPKDVCDMFDLEDLEKFSVEVEHLQEEQLEGIYKDLLSMSE